MTTNFDSEPIFFAGDQQTKSSMPFQLSLSMLIKFRHSKLSKHQIKPAFYQIFKANILACLFWLC